MAERQTIMLFGDSLLMDAVEASLRRTNVLRVIRIPTTLSRVGDYIASSSADAVIFDWAAPYLELVVPLLKQCPGITLLGIDLQSDEVIALSSLPYSATNARDLARVVHAEVAYKDLRRDVACGVDLGQSRVWMTHSIV